MQKEKSFLKRVSICALAIILVYVGLQMSIRLRFGKDLVLPVINNPAGGPKAAEGIAIAIKDDSVIALNSVEEIDGQLCVVLTPKAKGTTSIEITEKATGLVLNFDHLRTTGNGIAISTCTGNFSNHRHSLHNMVFLFTALTILLWGAAIISYRKLRYSYHTIFYIGFGLWITIIDVILICNTVNFSNMLNIYSTLQNSATTFIYHTALLILLFSILLCISNVSLIRHEGKGIRRMLGILLSLAMVGGAAIIDLIDTLVVRGSEFNIDLWTTIINSIACVYAVLECFLFGSMVCGSLAAKHTPAYDRDYVIILGCKVRADGTLYPLIRSRVDRAIGFVRRQKEKTGKQAIFLPTGGQGCDESISEAAAMQRYLIEQGIAEEHILIEDKARNTRENMLFSKALIDRRTPDARIAFATTNYHVLRSGIISRQVEVEADGMGSPTKWYFWPNAYIREMIGMLSYKKKTLLALLVVMIVFTATVRFLF